jgi:farnesyl diphosphate synthase
MLHFSSSLTTQNHVLSRSAASKDELREFMAIWPDLVRDLTEYAKKYETEGAPKWFAKSLQYNCPNGKKNRGLALVLAYKMLAPSAELTEENLQLAQTLGWCVEMLQSVFIMADDIMDGSETRRGHKCWYKADDVGLCAINDSMMIENGIYFLLKKYFGDKEYYNQIVDLFHEVTFITTIGQLQDLKTAGGDVTTFTMEKYKTIVANKTAYYSFYLPVCLAMYMSGFKGKFFLKICCVNFLQFLPSQTQKCSAKQKQFSSKLETFSKLKTTSSIVLAIRR